MVTNLLFTLLFLLICSHQLSGSESVLVYEYGAPKHQKFYYVHPSKVKRSEKEGNLFYITNHRVLVSGVLINSNHATVTYRYDQKNPLMRQTIPLKEYITIIDNLAKKENDRCTQHQCKTHVVNITLNSSCIKPLLSHLPMNNRNHVAELVPRIAHESELSLARHTRLEMIHGNKVEPHGLNSL